MKVGLPKKAQKLKSEASPNNYRNLSVEVICGHVPLTSKDKTHMIMYT